MKARKLVALILAMMVVLGIFASCGGTKDDAATTDEDETVTSEETEPVAEDEEDVAVTETSGDDLDDGATNREGLPITKEPVTISAGVIDGGVLRPDLDSTSIWDYVEEKTNIRLDVETYKDSEKVDLMFASNDLPDLLMNVGMSAAHMNNSIAAGSFVPLDPLVDEFMPTWKKFFDAHPFTYNAACASTGELYSMPYIDFAEFDRNLRDQMLINGKWLDEIGMEVPTTVDEFTDVLRAIKDSAGTGTIPEEVAPYYFYHNGYVGGQFDIYNFFGVYISDGSYLVVEDGVVKDQSTNPDLKEPLKYLKSLYDEGLIPPECFTDDWTAYVSKISSDPHMVGVYSSYANRHIEDDVPFGPLDSGNGKTPYIRSQAYVPGPGNLGTISSTNPYPVATARLFEWIASDKEALLTVSRGQQGVFWDYNEDGKAYELLWEDEPERMAENSKDMGTHNSFIALKADDFYENVWYEKSYDVENSRGWAYKNVYEGHTLPNDMVYFSGVLGDDDNDMVLQYNADLANVRNNAIADFIIGRRDIDADWDAYVEELESLGLEEYVALRQKGYDMLKD